MSRNDMARPHFATMQFRADSFDKEAGTVDIVWSTGARVRRWGYDEELDMSDGAIRFDRIKSGLPFLKDHLRSVDAIIGTVLPDSVRVENGVGLATVRRSKDAAADGVWAKIANRDIRDVSVGYIVHKYEHHVDEDSDAPALYRATDWEPFEVSAVVNGADPAAQIRSDHIDVPAYETLIERIEPMPEKAAKKETAAPEAPAEAIEERKVDIAKLEREATREERGRITAINALCDKHKVSTGTRNEWIDGGHTLDHVRELILDDIAGRADEVEVASVPAEPTSDRRDEMQTRREALEAVIGYRLFGEAIPQDHPANEIRHMRVRDIAAEFSDKPRFRHSENERIADGMFTRAGMHGIGDFSNLLGSAMNRALRMAYEARPATFTNVSMQRSASDFRALHSIGFGGDFQMRAVNEHGEYHAMQLAEQADNFSVVRYGREVNISFEALVNDDLDGFGQIPANFARAARNREDAVVWALINANGNMADGVALFATAATRANLASSGAAISDTTVGAGRKAMWEQRPVGAATATDSTEFIMAQPDRLLVPPALEQAARAYIMPITPATTSNVNVFGSTVSIVVTPFLSAKFTNGSDGAWYLVDSGMPPIQHAWLEGFDRPQVSSEEKRNPKGITYTAEMVFGAGVVDFRGIYKNPGA